MIGTDEILSKITSLPTLPASVSRLAALLGDEQAGIPEFEAVIRPDPALTANLLRLANSAFFGCQREVTSVAQAIAVMGLKRVFEVAASASFTRVIPAVLPGYGVGADVFWSHCIAVAALTERLGRELNRPVPGLAFTAGLLHDAGKLAIGSFLLDDAARLRARMAEGRIPFVAAEKAVLGIDHTEVGSAVASRWGLPPAIGIAARWHHRPTEAGPPDEVLLASLVHAADCLAHAMGFGAEFGGLRRDVDRRVVELYDLHPARLERVADATLGDIHEMSRLLVAAKGARP